jgi:hypothetical protein
MIDRKSRFDSIRSSASHRRSSFERFARAIVVTHRVRTIALRSAL